MSIRAIILLVSTVLGGLALFIFGMDLMTDGLRAAAGGRLRGVIAKAARSRLRGLALGTGVGTLVHSSATTVMLVGFVNAGLMTLQETVPPMLGANVGTSLSMQAISFKLGEYCFVAIVLGMLLRMLGRGDTARRVGQSLLGFGLLFLGMNTMSAAIEPHKASLAPFLTAIEGTRLSSVLLGVGLSTALTAVWQSSGATIGLCFALATAGVYTRLDQVYPIILGAHIGTCATALLGSVGTNIEARRAAVSHLVFNVLNVAAAVILRRPIQAAVALTSDNLVHQIANTHTLVMSASALLLLPFTGVFTRFVRLLTYSKKPPPERSFLDRELLHTPERAIVAALHELHRAAVLCGQSLRLAADVMLLEQPRHAMRTIRGNEAVINDIKRVMREYLADVARKALHRRQTIMVQHIDRCMVEIERIGDHIESVSRLSLLRKHDAGAALRGDVVEKLFALYESVRNVLRAVIASLAIDANASAPVSASAPDIEKARAAYLILSASVRSEFMDAVSRHDVTPVAGMYLAEYMAAFDRLVYHAGNVAEHEHDPDFGITPARLDEPADTLETAMSHDAVDAHALLARLDANPTEPH